MIAGSPFRIAAAGVFVLFVASARAGSESLFESVRVTPPHIFTRGIEGPAVDAAGALYVQNFGAAGTIGVLRLGAQDFEAFARLPAGSVGNGARFDSRGRMFVADFKKHNVFMFEPNSAAPRLYFHSAGFFQPNDLAIAKDSTLYASDPVFSKHKGRVWRIAGDERGAIQGAPMTVDRPMGVANGVDLSPDERTLYVSESDRNEIWAYEVTREGLSHSRLVKKFDDDGELDGLRTDNLGRIYVARQNVGRVSVLSPQGEILHDVVTNGKKPSNLAFGGVDGRTVFVTQVDGGLVEAFKTDAPGREFCLQITAQAC